MRGSGSLFRIQVKTTLELDWYIDSVCYIFVEELEFAADVPVEYLYSWGNYNNHGKQHSIPFLEFAQNSGLFTITVCLPAIDMCKFFVYDIYIQYFPELRALKINQNYSPGGKDCLR
jgi:hypothetical protein